MERRTRITCGSHHQITTKFNCLEVLQKRHCCIWTLTYHILHFCPKLKEVWRWRIATCYQLFIKHTTQSYSWGSSWFLSYLSVVQAAMKPWRTPEKTIMFKNKQTNEQKPATKQPKICIYLIRCTCMTIIKAALFETRFFSLASPDLTIVFSSKLILIQRFS